MPVIVPLTMAVSDDSGESADHQVPLVDDRRSQHSIRINDPYRACLRWEDGYAENVEVMDYH